MANGLSIVIAQVQKHCQHLMDDQEQEGIVDLLFIYIFRAPACPAININVK